MFTSLGFSYWDIMLHMASTGKHADGCRAFIYCVIIYNTVSSCIDVDGGWAFIDNVCQSSFTIGTTMCNSSLTEPTDIEHCPRTVTVSRKCMTSSSDPSGDGNEAYVSAPVRFG